VHDHDNSLPVSAKFMSIGASKLKDPKQIVMTLDHDVQNKSEKESHQVSPDRGICPEARRGLLSCRKRLGIKLWLKRATHGLGVLVVASDSHSNMYGGIGCLGTPVVRTDAANIWATGRTWWQIPPVAKVTFTGVLPKGVTGTDVIVALCGLFDKDDVLNHAIEFTGSEETLKSLQVDDRLTISNMTTEWGALTAISPWTTS
jgi:homoaconitate hydratase